MLCSNYLNFNKQPYQWRTVIIILILRMRKLRLKKSNHPSDVTELLSNSVKIWTWADTCIVSGFCHAVGAQWMSPELKFHPRTKWRYILYTFNLRFHRHTLGKLTTKCQGCTACVKWLRRLYPSPACSVAPLGSGRVFLNEQLWYLKRIFLLGP